jgi:hypothetical protein
LIDNPTIEALTLISVVSSNLRAAGYDKQQQIMDIEFLSGRIYRYFGVPQKIYAQLLTARSKGSWFARNIRGKFKYKRIH